MIGWRRLLTNAILGGIATTIGAVFLVALFHVLFQPHERHSTNTYKYVALVACALGAAIGARMGAKVLPSRSGAVAKGVIAGIASASLLGLLHSAHYVPPFAEEIKFWWLVLGMPCGAIVGGILGWYGPRMRIRL